MVKNLTLMFVLFFIGTSSFVSAGPILTELFRFRDVSNHYASLAEKCPKTDILDKNSEWVEHTEVWNKNISNILAIHFSLPFAPLKPAVFLPFFL